MRWSGVIGTRTPVYSATRIASTISVRIMSSTSSSAMISFIR